MPRRAVSTVVKVIDPSLLLEIVRMPVRWLPPAGPCTPLDSFAGADMCDSMLTVGGSSGSPHATRPRAAQSMSKILKPTEKTTDCGCAARADGDEAQAV